MILLLSSLSLAYDPVAGIDFPNKSVVKEYGFYHDINFRFRVNRQADSGFFDQLIYRAIYDASLSSFQNINELGLLDRQCAPNEFLEIYEISESQLNDPKRFPADFVGNIALGRGSLLGFYDPRNSESYIDAIVITAHDNTESYRIVVHELAHYWYARFCLQDRAPFTSEQFALKIQSRAIW
jgi:hypothetical protein